MPKKQKSQEEKNYNRLTSSIEKKILDSEKKDEEQSKKSELLILFSFILFAIIIYFVFFSNYCGSGKHIYNGTCITTIYCEDNTLAPECSLNKPYQCIGGELIEKASLCGCPEGYSGYWDICLPLPKCDDGTLYNNCSKIKPLYCENGILINKSSICGCPTFGKYETFNDICISLNRKYPEIKQFYFQRYIDYNFNLTMHKDMFESYSQKEHFDDTYEKSLAPSWKPDFSNHA